MLTRLDDSFKDSEFLPTQYLSAEVRLKVCLTFHLYCTPLQATGPSAMKSLAVS